MAFAATVAPIVAEPDRARKRGRMPLAIQSVNKANAAGRACTSRILRLTVAAPYRPATITQSRKKTLI
jgi:hypothetical protein